MNRLQLASACVCESDLSQSSSGVRADQLSESMAAQVQQRLPLGRMSVQIEQSRMIRGMMSVRIVRSSNRDVVLAVCMRNTRQRDRGIKHVDKANAVPNDDRRLRCEHRLDDWIEEVLHPIEPNMRQNQRAGGLQRRRAQVVHVGVIQPLRVVAQSMLLVSTARLQSLIPRGQEGVEQLKVKCARLRVANDGHAALRRACNFTETAVDLCWAQHGEVKFGRLCATLAGLRVERQRGRVMTMRRMRHM